MGENVILVVVDALRADRVGVLGNKRDLTPNIDSLATENGTVFENAFSASNATDPSITSMHSGRDPLAVVRHHGPNVTDAEKQRAESVKTVPEILQKNGINTIASGRMLGRWHKSGFDQYPEPVLHRNRRRKIGEFLGRIASPLRTAAGYLYEKSMSLYQETKEQDEIDRFLENISSEPLYGFIHLMDTHIPYEPETEVVESLLDDYDYPRDDLAEFFETHSENEYVQDIIADFAEESDYEYGFGRLIARYDGAVREADEKIGRLIAGLKEQGIYEDTTIIVTGDHGESLDEHGIFFEHHGLYDQSIHVPLIISGPNAKDQCRSEMVRLPDLAPTILEYFGVESEELGTSRSLLPLLRSEDTWNGREYVVVNEAQAQSRLGIRTKKWKYIKYEQDPVLEEIHGDSYKCGYCNMVHEGDEELYNLLDDPAEENNVVEQNPEKATELDQKLEAFRESLESPSESDSSIEYSDESQVMERLEELGYR